MAISTRKRNRPQKQNTQSAGTPAPVLGLVANAPLYGGVGGNSENHQRAIWLYNLVPAELGVAVRPGSAEVVTGLIGNDALPADVRTVVYYNSQVSQGAGGIDFFFAMTDVGIYDITAGGLGPWVPAVAWPTPGGDAGWCSVHNFTNVAGDHYLLVADEINGYYIFDGTVWTQGAFAGPNDPTPESIVHIVEWQGRIWFVERDTSNAWYTVDAGAIEGNLTALNMGSRFEKGGHLVQLGVWTVDDGAGMDDNLVAVSSSGDLLVWNLGGSFNPGNPDDLRVQGRWFVGSVPEGRRVLSGWGGDMLILSSFGIVKLSSLLGGNASINQDSYITKNITRYIRNFMDTVRDNYGWQMELNPTNGTMLVSTPLLKANDPPIQFALNVNTQTWSMYRDLDMRCMDKNGQGFFFGTSDGRVMTQTGSVDNVSLPIPNVVGTWTYEGVEETNDPPAMNWNHNAAQTVVRVDKTDLLAADRSADLLSLPEGARLELEEVGDMYYHYLVTGPAVDAGTAIHFPVILESTSPNGPPTPGQTTTFTGQFPVSVSTINWSMLSHYSNMGSPAQWKRCQFIRPSFVGDTQPTYGVQARYDFDLAEVGVTPAFLGSNTPLWDVATWDNFAWPGQAQSYINISGLSGMGRHIAIAMRGESTTALSIIGFDLMYDVGGML